MQAPKTEHDFEVDDFGEQSTAPLFHMHAHVQDD